MLFCFVCIRYAKYSEVKTKLTSSVAGSGQSCLSSFITNRGCCLQYQSSQSACHHRGVPSFPTWLWTAVRRYVLSKMKIFVILLACWDSKYSPVCQSSVTSRIAAMVTDQQESIRVNLRGASSVSATVDIWSDRRMRGFLGVTAHTMDVSQSVVSLKSHLLSCSRFKGSHTGERISDAFEAVCDDCVIKNKLVTTLPTWSEYSRFVSLKRETMLD